MKIVTFVHPDGSPRAGVLLEADSTQVVDLAAACSLLGRGAGTEDPAAFANTIALFAAGPAGLDAARAILARIGERAGDEQVAPVMHAHDDIRLLAPVPRPPRLRDYFTSGAHARGCGVELPPVYKQMGICYKANHLAVTGPDDDIVWPPYTNQLDYELEPAFVVGAAGRNIPVADARQHIAGVTLFNDVSARDIQGPEMSLFTGPSKSKDFCNVIGPCVATLDDLDVTDLELEARINGEVWSRGDTRDADVSIEQILAWASYGEDVHPGEVLGLGTVGTGCGVEIGRWIAPGDVIEFEMTGVGVLRNRVGAKEIAPPDAGLPNARAFPRWVTPEYVGHLKA